MFDDARFYSKLAENSRAYGKVRCNDCAMYLKISALDTDDDLLAAIEKAEDFLLD